MSKRKSHLDVRIQRFFKGGYVAFIDGDPFYASTYKEACLIVCEIILRDEVR